MEYRERSPHSYYENETESDQGEVQRFIRKTLRARILGISEAN